jgi:DNA invertase Pin-like site-specific DNA recombinase
MLKTKQKKYFRNLLHQMLDELGEKNSSARMSRDIKAVRFYREKEISHGVFQKPVFSELLLDLEENDQGIRTLLVEKMDQLAQDLTVQSAIIWELRSQGFEVISALEDNVWNT